MPITADRRRLWRLYGFLAVNGTLDVHHRAATDLVGYLCRTCDHFWDPVPVDCARPPGYDGPDLLQCRYCDHVQPRRAAVVDDEPVGRGPHTCRVPDDEGV